MCSAAFPTSPILCVDDSETMLIICQTMLEANGYKVHTAHNGKAALQILETHPIDLVIVDNRMPGMSRAELAKEIKQLLRNLPVLMFSDSGGEPTASESVDLFVNKKAGHEPCAMPSVRFFPGFMGRNEY